MTDNAWVDYWLAVKVYGFTAQHAKLFDQKMQDEIILLIIIIFIVSAIIVCLYKALLYNVCCATVGTEQPEV